MFDYLFMPVSEMQAYFLLFIFIVGAIFGSFWTFIFMWQKSK